MRLFDCDSCGQLLDFANTRCERCGHVLGFVAAEVDLHALEPVDGQRWRLLDGTDRRYRFCANARHDACNWLIAEQATADYCEACQLNRTVPDLNVAEYRFRWQRLEQAKRRLVYGLLRLGLPLANRFQDPWSGLAFDFLAGAPSEPVVTGHARGLITIDVAEADDVERERYRSNLAEPYRTILGHFRHEVGHYYWERLVEDAPPLEAFRARFGDERLDYPSRLESHYEAGPAADWSERHISAYASAHPWEDWAETWAHYLHMVDTLETASWFHLRATPAVREAGPMSLTVAFDPYLPTEFDTLIETWIPLTFVGNSLNRSMGQPDLYPFVLSPPVVDKLRFIHNLVRWGNPGGPA